MSTQYMVLGFFNKKYQHDHFEEIAKVLKAVQ